MSRNFSRTIEDFTCENCGEFVKGNGYTNHCPTCLYSKHVDVNPGDRSESCNSLMKPISRNLNPKKIITILHECSKCGFIRKNKVSKFDNEEKIYSLNFQ